VAVTYFKIEGLRETKITVRIVCLWPGYEIHLPEVEIVAYFNVPVPSFRLDGHRNYEKP
jgi:hypothetical protein